MMKILMQIEMLNSEIKSQTELNNPLGLNYIWNLSLQVENLTLELMDSLYDSSNTSVEVV